MSHWISYLSFINKLRGKDTKEYQIEKLLYNYIMEFPYMFIEYRNNPSLILTQVIHWIYEIKIGFC